MELTRKQQEGLRIPKFFTFICQKFGKTAFLLGYAIWTKPSNLLHFFFIYNRKKKRGILL